MSASVLGQAAETSDDRPCSLDAPPKRQRCDAGTSFVVRSVVVTTDHSAQHTARAQQLASELSLNGQLDASIFVPREGETLVKLLERNAAQAVLVVGVAGTLLRLSNGSEHKLHGGMGVLRLRALAAGGADNMVDACGLRRGDVFIDATAGQLADALVAAHVVGPEGRVMAIEARRRT